MKSAERKGAVWTTIICDNHEIKDDTILPPAVALINPFSPPTAKIRIDNLAGVVWHSSLGSRAFAEFELESEIRAC